MFLYSSAIIAFTKKLHKRALEILAEEVKLKVHSKRFEYNGYLYPLSVHVFDGGQKIGYFDARFCYIGVHKKLMTCLDQKLIDNLLRHELAHYLCWIKYPPHIDAHGVEFRELCRSYGWEKEVYLAEEKNPIGQELESTFKEREKIVSRVQKLFNLAKDPSNPHEAQAATAKANELLLKYHLKDLSLEEQEEEVCRQQVLIFKRRSGKTDAILHILNQFYVQAIYSSGQKICCIEVVGDRESVELADYLAKYLDVELESLYKKAKKQRPEELKGLRARHAFFQGLAQGYIDQITLTKQSADCNTSALVAIQKKLTRQSELVYQGRIGKVRSSQRGDARAQKQGRLAGANLQLRAGLNQKKGPGLLSFFK